MSGPVDGITETDLGCAWMVKKKRCYWTSIRLGTADMVSEEMSGGGATLKTAVACLG